MVREGIRALLEKERDLSVVGETSDGLQLTDVVERTKPDVLVMDVVMPGLGGLDVAREVRRRSPTTRIVILSMYSSDAFVLEALRNGAAAYVLKDSRGSDLVQAIRQVLTGGRYLNPPLSERVIEMYVAGAKKSDVDAYELLTTREREVMHLAAEGLSNPAIGERLRISPRTVEIHRAHVVQKLGLRTRADLVIYALNRGLLPGKPEGALPSGLNGDANEG